ncbi:hypothetical protein BJX61DRAFT_537944 [Aspergillus egyptiacus]|nr:hypothetical protein BJX61DRAFT_537944 [Aspergillus egyptiacus]
MSHGPDRPPPGCSTEEFNAWFAAHHRHDIQRSIQIEGVNSIRGLHYNRVSFITCCYNLGESLSKLECRVHALWDMFFQAAMNTAYLTPEHDRWVLDLLRIREWGYVNTDNTDHDGWELAQTSGGGVLWADLPFVVDDMIRLWLEHWAIITTEQRANGARFLAKLATTGLKDYAMSPIFLHILREALETPRPLVRSKEEQQQQQSGTGVHSIEELIPAVLAVFYEAGMMVINLCDQMWNDGADERLGGGATELLGGGEALPPGFSPARWLFWLKRLDEIEQQALTVEELGIMEHASRALTKMLGSVQNTETRVLSAWKEAGGEGFIQHEMEYFAAHEMNDREEFP